MLGKIHLRSVLGEGGMGRVFSAHHEGMGCEVAIKVLGPAFEQHPQARERFLREARIASRVRSPHAVRVLEHACSEAVPYIIFERIDGEDLASRLHRLGTLTPSEVSTVVRQLASALDSVHAAGVVHCDVKLANVMVFENQGALEAKLIDFGVARALDETPLDGDEAPSGTIYAMSPEQILRPDEAAPHWDLWGLGVLAFTALTGRAPFQGKSMIGVLGAALQGQRESIDARIPLGGKIDEVFDRAFSIALQERYANATEFAEALSSALEPAFDEADAVLARITASLMREDEITAVRPRAEMTTRVPMAFGAMVPTQYRRRASWTNETNGAHPTSTLVKFGGKPGPMWKMGPSRQRTAAIGGK
jgi:eukaryotic-like serine/threonine-protein kinase